MSYGNYENTTDIVVSTRTGSIDKALTYQDYKKKLRFIKVALDKSDKEMSEEKVVDLPELMEDAKQELTVGKMNKLLKEEGIIQTSGVTKGIAGFLARLLNPGLRRIG